MMTTSADTTSSRTSPVPTTMTDQPPVSLFPVVAIILGIVIGFLIVLIFFICCGLVILTRYRQQRQSLHHKYGPPDDQYSDRVVRNLIAGVESDDVTTSTDDYSIDDDFSSFTGSYDEVDEIEEEDDASRRMEHLMDVIRNSPYINVS